MTPFEIATLIFAFIMSGNLDRLRGDTFDLMNTSKTVEALLYGLCVAICFQSGLWWAYITFPVLWLAGASPGWGIPLGCAVTKQDMRLSNEWHNWQIGILRKNVWLALAFRGLIWGVPPSLLGFFDPRFFSCLFMVIVFPAAAWFDRNYDVFGTWKDQEYYRGWMIAAIAIATAIIYNYY
jgi:hypothetical protein